MVVASGDYGTYIAYAYYGTLSATHYVLRTMARYLLRAHPPPLGFSPTVQFLDNALATVDRN